MTNHWEYCALLVTAGFVIRERVIEAELWLDLLNAYRRQLCTFCYLFKNCALSGAACAARFVAGSMGNDPSFSLFLFLSNET